MRLDSVIIWIVTEIFFMSPDIVLDTLELNLKIDETLYGKYEYYCKVSVGADYFRSDF